MQTQHRGDVPHVPGPTPGNGPGLGHVLGWQEQLFLISTLLVHCDRLLQLSPDVSCPERHFLLTMRLQPGGRGRAVKAPPTHTHTYRWNAASAIMPPSPLASLAL